MTDAIKKTIKDASLRTKSSRRNISDDDTRKLHVVKIVKGLALGYRKGVKGGSWIARRHESGTKYSFEPLGIADDTLDADGIRVLTFDQAHEAAETWFKRKPKSEPSDEDIIKAAAEAAANAYNVSDALDDYLRNREKFLRKKLDRTRSVVETHIRPSLGSIPLSKLADNEVQAWLDGVADASPRVRNKPGATNSVRKIDMSDPDVLRKRQATANRILTVLKAALNFARKKRKVATKAAWETITPFGNVDVPKVRYLTVEECKRLIAVCPADFGSLVRAAVLTGCRYGELTAMRVHAYSKDSNTIHVEQSKSGKPRYIPLSDEGSAFFQSITRGKADQATLFTHTDGKRKDEAWEPSQQTYWMDYACETAKIAPAIGFHILRHTYASQLAMNGTPMPVIAALLGHADTRMTEKHYGHLAPSYIASTLRANLPSFGFEAGQPGPILISRAS